jgi:hypothetical protein
MLTLATRRTLEASDGVGDKRQCRFGLLQVKREYLECGDWIAPTARLLNVLLFEISWLPLDVLRFDLGGHRYQFMILRNRQLRRALGAREIVQARLAVPEFPAPTRIAALLAAVATGFIGFTR